MSLSLFGQKKPWTKRKHIILENYLSAWIKVLKNKFEKIFYVDCFAGKGIYEDETHGSPLIAYEILTKGLSSTATTFKLFLIEKDKKTFEELKDNLNKAEIKENKKIVFKKDNYQNCIGSILDEIGNSPAFFFIDPSGFKDIPFELLLKIFQGKRKEGLITFMYDFMNRFKDVTPERIYKALGIITNESLPSKEVDFIKHYCSQFLKKGLYTTTFQNKYSERDRTFYYLVFVSSNFYGLKIMWNVMRKIATTTPLISLFHQLKLDEFKKHLIYLCNDLGGFFSEKTALAYLYLKASYEYKDKELKDLLKVPPFKKIKSNGTTLISCPQTLSETNLSTEDKEAVEFFKQYLAQNTEYTEKVYCKQYSMLDGSKKELVERVGNGSIIVRFDKTPPPQKANDVVCPHFLELKWAYGCPYDCAWCYLKGTFRMRKEGIKPAFKKREIIKSHLLSLFREKKGGSEALNAGEIADSLMGEFGNNPFSKFITPLFETQNKYKLLFVTKGTNIKHLLDISEHKNTVVSFSINATPVAERWEYRAPSVYERIMAAKKLYEAGYTVRFRIDPMVPIENWQLHYRKLIEIVFQNLIPERITIGSLRGLQSTINGVKDKSWINFLEERTNWGKRISFSIRLEMYSYVVSLLNEKGFYNLALCKETIGIWEALKLDWRNIRCNCLL
ncbi:MAG: hypothetical protein DRP41_01745 [Thermodesulfobacteriota bacterium]|nr:MAG: hypothetical protein DRP41_01745 [Thermodesulfobacteriota bacterium]